MDWIKKVFKGCAHKSSDGHYHGHYAEDRQFYTPSGSGVFTFVTIFCFSFSIAIYMFLTF